MQKLITIVFATVISLPAQAAGTNLPENLTSDPCGEVISACDRVIEKQDKLLLLQLDRINVLQSENEKLSAAIVKMNQEENKRTSVLVYAGGGFLVGVITMLLIQGNK